MAKHRMVSKDLIFTDKFLRMPHSQMSLYFALLVLADDDGIYEAPKDLMGRIRATEVDMQQLISNGFILFSDNGAVAIAHWLWHNRIREGRYRPSQSPFANDIGVYDNGVYGYLCDMEGEHSLADLTEIYNHQRRMGGKNSIEPLRLSRLKDVKKFALSLPQSGNVNDEINKNALVYQWYTDENVNSESNKNALVYQGKESVGEVRLDKERVHTKNVNDESNIILEDFTPAHDCLYGDNRNVFLTMEEYKSLYEKYADLSKLINKVSYILLTVNSKASKNHFAYLNKIAIEDDWPRKADVIESQKRKAENLKRLEESYKADEGQAYISYKSEDDIEDVKERKKEMIGKIKKVSPFVAERLIEAYEREFKESFDEEGKLPSIEK